MNQLLVSVLFVSCVMLLVLPQQAEGCHCRAACAYDETEDTTYKVCPYDAPRRCCPKCQCRVQCAYNEVEDNSYKACPYDLPRRCCLK